MGRFPSCVGAPQGIEGRPLDPQISTAPPSAPRATPTCASGSREVRNVYDTSRSPSGVHGASLDLAAASPADMVSIAPAGSHARSTTT